MASTVRDQFGGVFAQVPAGWQPEQCPDLTREPWDGTAVPWRTPITAWSVDSARSIALTHADVNVKVDLGVPGPVWDGAVAGMPFQTVANQPTTPVWDLARPVTWNWFSPTFPIAHVPLPNVVRREGDPLGAWDRHAYIIDTGRNLLYELIQLDNTATNRFRTWWTTEWCAGWNGSGPGVAVWNMSKAWNGAGQPGGIVAANVPHLPHFVRADELARGRITHALFMALADYAPGVTGYARRSDGTARDHPCRGGERLRLPADAVKWYEPGTPERIVAQALHEFGVIVGDRNDHSGSATSKPGVIAAAQDPRLTAAWKGLGIRLSDLQVVTQP